MPTSRRTLLKTSAAAAAAFSLDWTRAQAQAETLRIGVIYDLTGPFAAGGSVASSIGAQIAIDLVNEKGGIGGKYKVAAVTADSQSKPDVAINEAVRLIDQEKVDIINGVYASSHAVPLAARSSSRKKSSGSRPRLQPRYSRTRTCNTSSGRRFIPISTARPLRASSASTPRPSSASSPRM
jgi:branched-chain amino acid transport system substrate-binding protein